MTSPDQPVVARFLTAAAIVLPALLVVVRAFWLAHGDMLVMMDVLRRVDFLSLLAGSVILSLQSGAVLLVLAAYRAYLMFSRGRAATVVVLPTRTYLMTSVGLVILVLLTSNYWFSFLTVAGSAALGTLSADDQAPYVRRALVATATVGAGLVSFFVLALSATAPWPPPELLRVTGEPAAHWVYVLSVEDTHTSVLYPEGGVARIPNDDVAERALCPESTIREADAGWTPSALQSALSAPGARVPPLCVHAPSPKGL